LQRIPLKKALPHGKENGFWTWFPIALISHDAYRSKVLDDDPVMKFHS
jgi:hypothetical protein